MTVGNLKDEQHLGMMPHRRKTETRKKNRAGAHIGRNDLLNSSATFKKQKNDWRAIPNSTVAQPCGTLDPQKNPASNSCERIKVLAAAEIK